MDGSAGGAGGDPGAVPVDRQRQWQRGLSGVECGSAAAGAVGVGVEQGLDPGGAVGEQQGPRVRQPGEGFDGLGLVAAGVGDRDAGPLVDDGRQAAPRREGPAQDAAVAGAGGKGGPVGRERHGVEGPVVRLEGRQEGGGAGVADVDQVDAALAGGGEHGRVGGDGDAVQLGAVSGSEGERGDGPGVVTAQYPEYTVGADGGELVGAGQHCDPSGAGGGWEA